MSLVSASLQKELQRRMPAEATVVVFLLGIICIASPPPSEAFAPGRDTPSVSSGRGSGGASRPAPGPPAGSGGGGFGFGIGIQLQPRAPVPAEPPTDEPAISEEESEDQSERVEKRRSPRIRETDRKTPSRKLAKPRVPYLSELAMDIDSTLKTLAWNQPATATGMYMNLLAASVKARDASAERAASTNLGHVYYLLGPIPGRS